MKDLLFFDLSVMLRKKEFAIAMSGMLILSVFSLFYSMEIQSWYGWQDYNLVSGIWMTMIASVNRAWGIFTSLFPFLVILPYSLSYLAEWDGGLLPAILTRVSRRNYCLSKMIACFLGNVLIILIPFSMSVLFSHAAFSGLSNLPGVEYRLLNYGNLISGKAWFVPLKYPVLPMARLFVNHPFWYAFVHILILAGTSGIFGVFLLMLSFLVRRIRAVLLLPVFLLVRITSAISDFSLETSMNDPTIPYVNHSLMDQFCIGVNNAVSPFLLPVIFVLIFIFCIVVTKAARTTDFLTLGYNNEDPKNKKDTLFRKKCS